MRLQHGHQSAPSPTVAKALGEEMAARGIGLVYGGGRLGLMGVVADAVMRGGGEVYGVIPQALIDLEVAHTGLHRAPHRRHRCTSARR